jgi:hypothetical protein
MVIDGNGQFLFGCVLSNHVLVEILFQFQGTRQLAGRSVALFMPVIFNDGVANGDTFVADIGSGVITGRGYELSDYVLTFMTERTAERVVRSSALQATTSFLPEFMRSP